MSRGGDPFLPLVLDDAVRILMGRLAQDGLRAAGEARLTTTTDHRAGQAILTVMSSACP